jgi:hypothetical protein
MAWMTNKQTVKIQPIPDEIILECKTQYRAEMKRTLSPESYKIRKRSLKYFDYLICYNKMGSFKAVSVEFDECTGNASNYVRSAYQRVCLFIKNKERGE